MRGALNVAGADVVRAVQISSGGHLIWIPLNYVSIGTAPLATPYRRIHTCSFSRWSDKSLEHSTHVQGIYRNLYYMDSAKLRVNRNSTACHSIPHSPYLFLLPFLARAGGVAWPAASAYDDMPLTTLGRFLARAARLATLGRLVGFQVDVSTFQSESISPRCLLLLQGAKGKQGDSSDRCFKPLQTKRGRQCSGNVTVTCQSRTLSFKPM